MTGKIRLGLSTCPNDTFALHALMSRSVDWRGLDFEFSLLDIQQLNDQLFEARFDVAKTSFHAALYLSDTMIVLPVGSALGFGVGPLLLSSQPNGSPTNQTQLTLCPGQHTTAALLFSLFYPQRTQIENCVFSEIMPRLSRGEADFGVCIHEGRFTWQQAGLGLVEDLGTRWEQTTGQPLPLGGLVARRDLTSDVLCRLSEVLRDSLDYALADPDAALPTMRRYAQEFDDRVLMQHVELYVNEWTRDLGEVGQQALDCLSQMAASTGLVHQPLKVFGSH